MDQPPEMGFDALLRRSIGLLRAHPLPLLLPPVILSLLTGGGDGGRGDMRMGDWIDPGSMDPLSALPFYALVAGIVAAVLLALVLVALIVVALVIVTSLVYAAVSRALLDHLAAGAAPDFGAAFGQVSGRWTRLAWTFFLACVVVIVGFILLVVPGVIALSAFLPLFAILASESPSGPDALRRAWELTKGHKGTLALVVLAGVAANIVVGLVLGGIPFVGWIASGVTSGAVSAVWLVVGVLVYRHATQPAAPAAPPAPAMPAGP